MQEDQTSDIVVFARGLGNKVMKECKNQVVYMKAGKCCPHNNRSFTLREEGSGRPHGKRASHIAKNLKSLPTRT
jgi:hypothetical protein